MTHNDTLYGNPWQSSEEREAKRAERHALWRSRLSEVDWARINALAKQVRPGFTPARLEELDAPGLAVGVCRVGEERLFSGERIGTVRSGEVAVLVWRK
jgi:hypothetical protein